MSKEIPDKNSEKGRAYQKIEEFGALSLTAFEHRLIGSTPPKELIDNPGRNSVELMSDEDIENYLDKSTAALEEIESRVGKNSSFYETGEGSLRRLTHYLRMIGRLPEKFKNLGG